MEFADLTWPTRFWCILWDSVVIVMLCRAAVLPHAVHDRTGSREPARCSSGRGHDQSSRHGSVVLQLAFSMGTVRANVTVVGCEPKDFGMNGRANGFIGGRASFDTRRCRDGGERGSTDSGGVGRVPGVKFRVRGDAMVWKIVCSAIGVLVVIGIAAVGPDVRRYMRMRSM